MERIRKPLCVALASLIFFGLLGSLAFGQSIDERFQQALEAELTPVVVEPVAIIIPPPVPDPDVPELQESQSEDSRPPLAVTYELPAKAAAAMPDGLYFVRYSAEWCQPCREMEAAGIYDQIRDAGFPLTEVDIDKNPDPRVTQVPQLWLCDKDRKRLRIWVGKQSAEDIFEPKSCDGLVRLFAQEKVGSGVILSDQFVLTAAHHDKREGFMIDLPIDSVENDSFVRIPAVLEKTDQKTDLCLLRFKLPPGVTVKRYELGESLRPEKLIGFPFGGKSKRIRAKLLESDWQNEFGQRLAKLQSPDITETQFGMSGCPALDDAGRIVGIQSRGRGRDIMIVPVETIADFLNGVDLSAASEAPALMTIEHAEANQLGDVLVSALAVHCLQGEGKGPAGSDTFGSLINVDFDAPDSVLEIARRVLSQKVIDFPAAGVSLEWSGDRRIELKPGRLAVSPGVQMRVSKFGLSKSCRLDAITYNDDLSSVTFELSGMIDLTVNLR
jgi:hypothetical protein